MEHSKRRGRRRHDAELKARVVGACSEPGASVARVAMTHGLNANDASHITKPTVEGQVAAMRAALQSASLDPSEIDAISAHGTGTLANDAAESAAIKIVFGARARDIPISATKSMHGHLLGAAGAMECVMSLQAMKHCVVLPTMHLREPDPQCDLDYSPNVACRGVHVRTMLSNSFAFGGANAVLALRVRAAYPS